MLTIGGTQYEVCFVLSCVVAFSSVANAEPKPWENKPWENKPWEKLEQQWKEQNSICLNGQEEWEGPLTPRMRVACNKRNLLHKQIRWYNRCYGKRDKSGGHIMEFHDCEPASLTYSWPSIPPKKAVTSGPGAKPQPLSTEQQRRP